MGEKKKLKILVADDSALLRSVLKQVFAGNNKVELVAEARNGLDAVQMSLRLRPDLVIMDIDMPLMNGLDATTKIMSECPVPILIFSNNTDAKTAFQALKCGAVEAMKKPDIDQLNCQDFHINFIEKIVQLSGSNVRSYRGDTEWRGKSSSEIKERRYEMIVIGASTGGPMALKKILRNLPADLSAGIAVVQHIEEGFDRQFVEWLNEDTKLKVKLARDGDHARAGEVYVAPAIRHLVFRNRKLFLDDGPRVLNQKPSVDILFETAAHEFGSALLGVLLTGMGSDGAEGCVKIRSRGGVTIVQNMETSTVFGMPKASIDRGGASVVLPLHEISGYIVKLVGVR